MSSALSRHALVLFASCALTASLEASQGWARFRGPAGAGVAAALDLPLELGPEAKRLEVELPGKGHSSPIFAGELVFLTSMGTDPGTRQLFALDALDGSPRWSFEDDFAGHRQHKLNSFASASPAADGQRVVIAWTNAEGLEVIALDHSGELLWRRALGPYEAQHGSGASPVIVAGLVIVANDMEGEGESFLVALVGNIPAGPLQPMMNILGSAGRPR